MLYPAVSGNYVYVQPTSSVSGLTCTPVSGLYLQLDMTQPNAKEVYATLLAAKVAQANLTIAMSSSFSACTIAYVLYK
jgi:hypothetical protein